MIAHILHEARSAPDAVLWIMWCGDNCVVCADGTLIPDLDFYHEQDGRKADCARCKKAWDQSVQKTTTMVDV